MLLLVGACAAPGEVCELDGEPVQLPGVVREASGLALSRSHDGVLWTHNDSDGGSKLFAVDADGRLLGTIALTSAHNRDWEDIAVASCPRRGPDGDCIYVADIGDNRAARDDVGLWVLAEPEPRDGTEPAVFIRFRYPDGPRDAEALVVRHDRSILVISKGRDHPVSVYRSAALSWPARGDDSTAIPLELVQRLSDAPVDLPLQVTGAALMPGDERIAIRSYARLQLYDLLHDSLAPVLASPVALDPLTEPQGEGVAVGRRGRVFLSSEAGPQGIAPRLTRLRCRLP